MCTAIGLKTSSLYFGRTLDNDFSYGEEVIITPRGFDFGFRYASPSSRRYAIIGMAMVADGYPLFYDAMNEHGLCIAGLNFVGNAVYGAHLAGKDNIAQFELIPWLLSQCSSLNEAKAMLEKANITEDSFSPTLPAAQLHWLLADSLGCITVEAVASGLKIYNNPVGVLTNNPPFDFQMMHLSSFLNLSAKAPENRFSSALDLKSCSLGMGAIGLPGDFSSSSRFVRAAFARQNSVCDGGEKSSLSQFFHIADTVAQPRGCNDLGAGKYEATLYTCCMSADSQTYYYTSYGNRQITAVDMKKEDLNGSSLIRHPLILEEQIRHG